MGQAGEPVLDVAHLGHIELLTPKPEESLWFFKDVLGMEETARQSGSVHLRGWGDFERHTLKLTEAAEAGLGHVAWRTMSPQALERRERALMAGGHGKGWIDGDIGHGPAYRFTDPDGHPMEVYYETEKYQSPESQRSYLPNQPQRFTGRGAAARRIDHLNLFCSKVSPNREFMQETLGFKLREHIVLDDEAEVAAWMSVTPQAHDIALTTDGTGSRGRLHHLAYWLDDRTDVLRAADIAMENDVFIELGPAKHSRTQGFFLYMYEPGGNRVELCSGGYLIYAPDWEPITWTQANLGRGTAWGTPVPETFHIYGTPVMEPTPATKGAQTDIAEEQGDEEHQLVAEN